MKLDELIQIKADGIDKAALLQQIEENLAVHALDGEVTFPTFHTDKLNPNKNGRPSAELLEKLAQIEARTAQLWLEPQLPPAKTALGRLLNHVKRPFHRLVIFYVNQLARQQNEINHEMRQLLAQLIAALDRSEASAND